MRIYMVRLHDPNVKGSVVGIELHAHSENAVRAFCTRFYRGYEVGKVIEEGSEEHQRGVAVFEQLVKMAGYSAHPAAKTLAIFAFPVAKGGMAVVELVNRAMDRGARNAEQAARLVWDELVGR
jgi:hypothetical protein